MTLHIEIFVSMSRYKSFWSSSHKRHTMIINHTMKGVWREFRQYNVQTDISTMYNQFILIDLNKILKCVNIVFSLEEMVILKYSFNICLWCLQSLCYFIVTSYIIFIIYLCYYISVLEKSIVYFKITYLLWQY